MDKRAEHDSPDVPGATQNAETVSADGVGDDGGTESPGSLARVRSACIEVVGTVVDAVLDAL